MQQEKKKQQLKNQKQQITSSAYYDHFSIILIVYALVPVLTPALGALDSTVSKFFVLGVINLLIYGYMVFNHKSSEISEGHRTFFLNPTGIIYSFLLVIIALSFIKAINVKESIIHFFQIFSVFYCVLILMMILKKDKKYLEQLSTILFVLLIIDCLTVFYNVGLFVNNQIRGIDEITSVYSNKNILSSAIFVKIPFVLWLHLYGRKRRNLLYGVVLCLSFLAIFLLSSRAFFIGSGLLVIVFLSLNILFYARTKSKIYLGNIIGTPVVLALAILISFLVQFLFYPDEKTTYTLNVADRLGTIEQSESSIQHRLQTWKIAAKMIGENPVLGIGSGNWKIAEIQYEGPTKADFKNYMTHTHNDFLEMTVETGVPGGILYILLFLIPVIYFLVSFLRRRETDEQEYLFLSAFGMICLSVDAFFNFPLGRVEIQILFAIFIASSAWINPFYSTGLQSGNGKWKAIVILTGIFSIPAAFFLYQSFISARVQKIAQEELLMEKFNHNSVFMLSSFPSIPDITVIGEPISVIKSRYLIDDRRYKEAISLLNNDKSSPYDGRQELMLIAAYERIGNKDSVLHYIRKFVEKKPLYYEVVAKNCYLEMEKGRDTVAIEIMQRYISKVDTNVSAWGYYSYLFQQAGNLIASNAVIDTALRIFPENKMLSDRKSYLEKVLGKVEK